jgi:hypothetical protein
MHIHLDFLGEDIGLLVFNPLPGEIKVDHKELVTIENALNVAILGKMVSAKIQIIQAQIHFTKKGGDNETTMDFVIINFSFN